MANAQARSARGTAPALRARSLLLALVLLACSARAGTFVWVDEYPAEAPQEDGYVIGPGDLLSVRVWNQENLTGPARVRSDGMITMPLVNDVHAAGATPEQLARRLEEALKGLMVSPKVTVAIEEPRVLQISVLGEVPRPGIYPLPPGSGVLQALAAAGGPTQYARRDLIFVLRAVAGGQQSARIRFTYDALAKASGRAASFRLREGDVVVVE